MLWACVKCTARRAAGMPHCPQCGASQYQHAPGGDVEPGTPVLDDVEPAVDETAQTKAKPARKAVPDVPAESAPAADAAPAAS